MPRPEHRPRLSTARLRRPRRYVLNQSSGNYVTSLDMAGCSVTLSMMDDEALSLWDAPVHTAALRWGC